MAIIYTKLVNEIDGSICIRAEIGNGEVLLIPAAEDNSDYQRYLRWLENPDAEENGTIS